MRRITNRGFAFVGEFYNKIENRSKRVLVSYGFNDKKGLYHRYARPLTREEIEGGSWAAIARDEQSEATIETGKANLEEELTFTKDGIDLDPVSEIITVADKRYKAKIFVFPLR